MEKKDIRQYLHFYLGCEVEFADHRGHKSKGTFFGFTDLTKLHCRIGFRAGPEGKMMYAFIKPILHRLEDMSEEELQECGNMVYDFSDDPELNNHKPTDFEICAPEQFHYLISKGYWLFGNDWFDEGLIIDAKTIKP